jgi:hypothetical protein
MPVSAVAQNVNDLKKIFKDIDKLVKKTGFANVAYSDTGMKVEDFTFSSLPQKALKAIWVREAAKHNWKTEDVDEAMYEGMNRWLKTKCYSDTKQKFLLRFIKNPEGGEKAEVTSSANWTVGEMTFFLDWMQNFCAKDGLILEAKGEYLEKTQSQDEV